MESGMRRGRIGRATRLALAPLSAAAMLLALPASGMASTAVADAGVVEIQGSPGEANAIAVAVAGADLVITDDAGVQTLPGICDQIGPREVHCALAGVTFLNIVTGDESDVVTTTTELRVAVSAGPGDDTYFALGRGPDQLSGGEGTDRISYANRTAGVTATPGAGLDDDGEPGERDFIMDDVEEVFGGDGDDVLGLAGLVDGVLFGGPGDDVLTGAATADTLLGDDGDDRLVGGDGVDDLDGGAGEDRIEARDDVVDAIDCGADADVAEVDADEPTLACEVVEAPDDGRGGDDGRDSDDPPGSSDDDPIRPTVDTTPPNASAKGLARVARDGTVSLKVTCDEACSGTLALVTAKKVRPTPRARAALLRLGSKRFALASAGTATVTVKLSAKHRALLKRLRKLGVKATLTVSDSAGNSRVAVTSFTAIAPRRR